MILFLENFCIWGFSKSSFCDVSKVSFIIHLGNPFWIPPGTFSEITPGICFSSSPVVLPEISPEALFGTAPEIPSGLLQEYPPGFTQGLRMGFFQDLLLGLWGILLEFPESISNSFRNSTRNTFREILPRVPSVVSLVSREMSSDIFFNWNRCRNYWKKPRRNSKNSLQNCLFKNSSWKPCKIRNLLKNSIQTSVVIL